MKVVEKSFLNRVVTVTIRDYSEKLRHPVGAWSRAATPSCSQEAVLDAQACDQNTSRVASFGGFPSTSPCGDPTVDSEQGPKIVPLPLFRSLRRIFKINGEREDQYTVCYL